MKLTREILERTKAVLTKYNLCDACLGRQFATRRGENAALGKMIREELGSAQPEKCGICVGIIESINSIANEVSSALKPYEFQTFLIGASLPSSIIETEDSIRSEFKLKGGESVKNEITKRMALRIANALGKKLDPDNADVTIVVNPVERFCNITSRSLYVVARYTKTKRGLSQKKPTCEECGGKGCPECEWTGFAKTESVESVISAYFITAFGAKKIKFSWIGSEDDESLVLGSGRPFYAEIIEPKTRKLTRTRRNAKLGNGIDLKGAKLLGKKPASDVPFELIVEADIKTSKPVNETELRTLGKRFRNLEIRQYSPNKQKFLRKKIVSFKATRMLAKNFKAMIRCEGGTNIKKLVAGNSIEVSPSISEVLGFHCETNPQKPFDILKVKILRKPVRNIAPVPVAPLAVHEGNTL